MSKSMINIYYMTNEAIETLRNNSTGIEVHLGEYSSNSDWLQLYLDGMKIYTEKDIKIPDFKLVTSEESDDIVTDNAKILYDSLKDLPLNVLSEERFWIWILFEKGYKAALEMMPVGFRGSKNIFRDHWLFGQGVRRSIIFTNVLARHFFNAYLTYDESLENPFELLEYTSERFDRYRNLTFRNSSNLPNVVHGTLLAQKKVLEKFGEEYEVEHNVKYYEKISKYISQVASVKLLDIIPKSEIFKLVYNFYIKLLLDDMKNNKQIDYYSSNVKDLRNRMILSLY